MVLINKDNKVFAGKRNSINTKMISWYLKKPWQMPQGGVEKDETPADAVLRELKEEIGTNNVEIIAETEEWFQYLFPKELRRKRGNVFIGQKQKWFLLKFLGDDSEINLKFSEHAEFDVWQWMSIGNIIRLSVHFKKKLYIDVFKSFKWYFEQNT